MKLLFDQNLSPALSTTWRTSIPSRRMSTISDLIERRTFLFGTSLATRGMWPWSPSPDDAHPRIAPISRIRSVVSGIFNLKFSNPHQQHRVPAAFFHGNCIPAQRTKELEKPQGLNSEPCATPGSSATTRI